MDEEIVELIPDHAVWSWATLVYRGAFTPRVETPLHIVPVDKWETTPVAPPQLSARGLRVRSANGYTLLEVCPCPQTSTMGEKLINLCLARYGGLNE